MEIRLGVKNIEVDLSNQVVRILGNSPVKNLTEALEQTGRKARLIGQGVPEGGSTIILWLMQFCCAVPLFGYFSRI